MKRLFVHASEFDIKWNKLGLVDDDLLTLEESILSNPSCGAVIEGTHGVRKLRFAVGNRGKSAGIRILQADFPTLEKTYFITLFAKNEKDNITSEHKRIIGQFILRILEHAKKGMRANEKEKTTTRKGK